MDKDTLQTLFDLLEEQRSESDAEADALIGSVEVNTYYYRRGRAAGLSFAMGALLSVMKAR